MFKPAPPPPVNPHYVVPSAPPAEDLPPPYYPQVGMPQPGYTHGGFFGDASLNHDQLGRDMLFAVVNNKTEWVIKAQLPQDSAANRLFHYLGGFFSSSVNPDHLDVKAKARLWRQAGEYFHADLLGDQKMLAATERKTDFVFQDFLSNLKSDERNAEYCYKVSLEFDDAPEAHFELGKLHFLINNYQKAVDHFVGADLVGNKLEHSSTYRINSFKALMKACAGAAQERMGYHDLALFNYIDASKQDPNGYTKYEESLSRNFQILKFKPNKTEQELQACMEYDPYEPDFCIELAHYRISQRQLDSALKLLNKANELAFCYKRQSLYRCVELLQQFSFCAVNS